MRSHNNEIEQLFDLYWGGPERRITGLTLRIIGVNVLALLSLLVGVVYLIQYQEKLIESHLKTFETELYLISTALGEGAITRDHIIPEKVEAITVRLAAVIDKRILVFNSNGVLVSDSEHVKSGSDILPVFKISEDNPEDLQSIEMLKSVGRFVLSFFPRRKSLQIFPDVISDRAMDYKDVRDSMYNQLSMSAWRDEGNGFVLTAAMPIFDGQNRVGSLLLISNGDDIRQAMGEAWFDIVKIFLLTLLVTIMLSIYLSGVIARPLRKLAQAAENVRKGKWKYSEIPDMRDRNDEIGELSIVLRDMTKALWQRMDSIEAFAADVAHELKNPLTSLKSAVETAEIVKKKEDKEKLMAIIRHDVERLDRLITDISNASRLDSELSREYFVPLNLNALLRNVLDMYKNPLEREGGAGSKSHYRVVIKDDVAIMLEMPEADVFVMGSEGRIIQVVQNILSNALSFAPVHSVIRIVMETKVRHIILSIEDQGPGIPENKLRDVFERFYSERPKHEDYGKHSGLGLSICKQIITAHNGLIYAENIKDDDGMVKGARFVMILNMA